MTKFSDLVRQGRVEPGEDRDPIDPEDKSPFPHLYKPCLKYLRHPTRVEYYPG